MVCHHHFHFSFVYKVPNTKHTANAVKSGTLSVMDRPPQSPDLNIIEAVWDHVDREQNKRQKHPKKSFECPSRSLENYS